MPFYLYFLRRLLFVIPTLLGITLFSFIIANAIPTEVGETQAYVKVVRPVIAGGHAEVYTGNSLRSQPVDQQVHHLRTMTLPVCSSYQVDVQVGRIFFIRFRYVVIRMMVEIVDLLSPSPTRWISGRFRKLRTQ